MDDTFAIMRTLEETGTGSAVIVGAGYVGLEMAEGLSARGLYVTQLERLPEVLPTVDPELGALVPPSLRAMESPCTRAPTSSRRPRRRRARPGGCAWTRSPPTASRSPCTPAWSSS